MSFDVIICDELRCGSLRYYYPLALGELIA